MATLTSGSRTRPSGQPVPSKGGAEWKGRSGKRTSDHAADQPASTQPAVSPAKPHRAARADSQGLGSAEGAHDIGRPRDGGHRLVVRDVAVPEAEVGVSVLGRVAHRVHGETRLVPPAAELVGGCSRARRRAPGGLVDGHTTRRAVYGDLALDWDAGGVARVVLDDEEGVGARVQVRSV